MKTPETIFLIEQEGRLTFAVTRPTSPTITDDQVTVYVKVKDAAFHGSKQADKADFGRVAMLPKPSKMQRVETGAVQFGDDWPGIFIRGDNAAHYSMALDSLLSGSFDPMTTGVLSGLNELLKRSKAI